MIKTREFPENNYRAVWYNGKTIRIALNPSKPITELEYPEFYDVKITGRCESGKCDFCYMDSRETDVHYTDIIDKAISFFGKMDDNQKPFQIAYGGGSPDEHPDFIELMRVTKEELGIVPNYTTNGVNVDNKLTVATKQYCGGVAVSCHPHLKKHWERAADMFFNVGVRLNFHLIISDKKSIDDFVGIFEKWKGKVEYFVLLPYGIQGRAKPKEINWDYLVKSLPDDTKQIAFGANFYPYLLKDGHGIKVSLYEPELLSKFIDLKDMKTYPSSFNLVA